MCPVVTRGFKRARALVFSTGEEVRGLEFAPVDAVARKAMEIQIDVNFVLRAKFDGTINLPQRLVVDIGPVGGLAPYPVGKRKARKIETPLLHHREIRLFKCRLDRIARRPLPLEIEPAIARKRHWARSGKISRGKRFAEKMRCWYCGDPRTGNTAQKSSSIHGPPLVFEASQEAAYQEHAMISKLAGCTNRAEHW